MPLTSDVTLILIHLLMKEKDFHFFFSKTKWAFGIFGVLLLFSPVSVSNEVNSAAWSWPSWLGGTYISGDCECKDYGAYHWRACKT